MKTAVIAIPLIMASITFAMDPPGVMWERVYFPDSISGFNDIRETWDEGFIVAGWRMPEYAQPSNACLFRLDAAGNIMWAFSAECYDQDMNAVLILPSEEIVSVGRMKLNENSIVSLAIVQTTVDGEIVWQKCYELPRGSRSYGYSMVRLPDGGFAICGKKDPTEGMDQAWVLRTDAQGDTLWTREWGWEYNDSALGVLYLDEGLTVLMQGRLESTTGGPHLVRYDMDGNLLWETAIPELAGKYAKDMCEASDGGLLILTEYCPVIAHTDYYGNVDWIVGPPSGDQPYGQSVSTTMNGGILYGGLSLNIPPGEDGPASRTGDIAHGMVTRHDSLGNELWRDYVYNFGCIAIYSVRQLSQGGYIAAGRTDTQGFLMRYAPELGVEEDGVSSGVVITGLTPNPSYGTVTV